MGLGVQFERVVVIMMVVTVPFTGDNRIIPRGGQGIVGMIVGTQIESNYITLSRQDSLGWLLSLYQCLVD